MRRTSVFIAVVLCAAVAVAHGVLDQQQPKFVSTGVPLAVGGTSEQKLAQTVTAGVEGELVSVHVPVSCESGSLVVEIVSVDGAHPGTTVLGRGEIGAAQLPQPSDTFRKIELETPVRMRAGQRFTIVLRNEAGACTVARPAAGDTYKRGDLFVDSRPGPKAWVPARDMGDAFYDLAFKTYVVGGK